MEAVQHLGESVTGGLLAHVLEPPTGGGIVGSGTCPNCTEKFHGRYCSHCGQAARLHSSLYALWHDLLHGVFHFEGKFWRTLPMLFFKPGELTRRYIAGERAKFVSPIALFLFSVFLMFAIFGQFGSWTWMDKNAQNVGSEIMPMDGMQEKVDRRRAGLQRELAYLQTQLVAARSAKLPVGAISKDIRDTRGDLQMLDQAKDSMFVSMLLADLSERRKGISKNKAFKDPQFLAYKLQSSAYKFSWLFIPILLPFMWLLFPFSKKYKVYHHAIFVINWMSFLSISLVAATAMSLFKPLQPILYLALTVGPLVHAFFHLKGAYSLRWHNALLRLLLFYAFFMASIGVFGVVLMAVALG